MTLFYIRVLSTGFWLVSRAEVLRVVLAASTVYVRAWRYDQKIPYHSTCGHFYNIRCTSRYIISLTNCLQNGSKINKIMLNCLWWYFFFLMPTKTKKVFYFFNYVKSVASVQYCLIIKHIRKHVTIPTISLKSVSCNRLSQYQYCIDISPSPSVYTRNSVVFIFQT